MAPIKIPTKYEPEHILIADDEPEHSEWLIDYLKAKGQQVTVVINVKEAIEASEKTQFRAYIIDLNIPLGGWIPAFHSVGQTYNNYAGLNIIKYVRSQGNKSRNVVAYSAHSNKQISEEIEHLYCGYVVKGRPRELKVEISRILSISPPSIVPSK